MDYDQKQWFKVLMLDLFITNMKLLFSLFAKSVTRKPSILLFLKV